MGKSSVTGWTFCHLRRPKLVHTSLIPFESMDSWHRKLSCVCINFWCMDINCYIGNKKGFYSLIKYDFYRHFSLHGGQLIPRLNTTRKMKNKSGHFYGNIFRVPDIFCLIATVHLFFVFLCYVIFVFCHICVLSYVQSVLFCVLSHLYFVFLSFVDFVFC